MLSLKSFLQLPQQKKQIKKKSVEKKKIERPWRKRRHICLFLHDKEVWVKKAREKWRERGKNKGTEKKRKSFFVQHHKRQLLNELCIRNYMFLSKLSSFTAQTKFRCPIICTTEDNVLYRSSARNGDALIRWKLAKLFQTDGHEKAALCIELGAILHIVKATAVGGSIRFVGFE